MNNLNKALLGGAALCALTAVPGSAESAGPFHFSALHGGRVVNKTKMPNQGATHLTYTFADYGYVSASTPLNTKINYQESVCPAPQKFTLTPKKTKFGKTSLNLEAYSTCEIVTSTYKLVKQPSPGDTDAFELSMSGKFEQNGTKYKETIHFDYDLTFE
jgi:hypothetical protein